MHYVADRKGKLTKENSMQDRFLNQLYGHIWGRMLLRPLILPEVSRLSGKVLDSKASCILIPRFIRKHSIHMEDFISKKYLSFNEFFKRRLIEGARSIETGPELLISPCDSRLSVYPITGQSIFSIKNTKYTTESLLKNKRLAESFAGGYIWIFRLCVEDYHRYIYVDDGYVSKIVRIPGVFHTVNPIAGEYFPIYRENTREYALLHTKHLGDILQMEVGAMLVGKIENRPGRRNVCRGQEKGNFAYGGSTVILMTKAGVVCPDRDILHNTRRGIETKVKLGSRVGKRIPCNNDNHKKVCQTP